MVWIGCLRIIIAVAAHTGSRRIGIIPLMTFITGQTRMCPLNRIKAVIKGGGCPHILRVTGSTIRRELLLYVIRTARLIEIVGMATGTGIGSIVEISTSMALVTVIGNSSMCSDQRIEIIVYGKGCRTPACIGRMTVITRSRQVQLCMVGVLTLCIIIAVATIAGVGRIVVIAVVAGRAVACNILVRPRQNIEVIVNGECSRFPGCRSMAACTISGDIQVQVTRIGSLDILVVVAACTGRGCTLKSCAVTLQTLGSLVSTR